MPRNRDNNTTLIASITLERAMGAQATMAMEGATDAEAFEGYVERVLAPTLSAGKVVIMDKLGAHRTERMRELIEGSGAGVLAFLLAGPNPIEEAFSKIKAIVRRAGVRARAGR